MLEFESQNLMWIFLGNHFRHTITNLVVVWFFCLRTKINIQGGIKLERNFYERKTNPAPFNIHGAPHGHLHAR